MMNEEWRKLWVIATGEPEGNAIIELTDDPEVVVLTWPDGSQSWLHWHSGKWRYADEVNTSPCDVAARDTL